MEQFRPEPPPEIKKKEQEARYSSLVLGHPIHEIDVDQICGVKVAEMLGLITTDVPVQCVPQVQEQLLEDPSVLVLEGFLSRYVF